VAAYYWLINKQGRQASRAYLDRIAPFVPELKLNGSWYWSVAHFFSFADAILDKLAAWAGKISLADVEYRGREELLKHVETGQGVMLLGSHLGNLEVCRVIASLHQDIRINVLVHTRHAEKFNELLNQYNEKSRLNLIQVTEISSATSIMLSDKIALGELVVIAADRTPVGNRQRETLVDFLGERAFFPQGPFILASLLKCPVFTVFCLKQQGKYVIYFDHFSNQLMLPRKHRELAMQQAIQKFADRLQGYCIKEPLQWFNFYDFWHVNP
jgi:predicted LPLAT superfamily acyltransferase